MIVKKRKIAYVASSLEGFGLVKMLFYLIKYLDKSKFEVCIITLSPEPKNTIRDKFVELGVDVISLGLSRVEGMFFAAYKLNSFIKSKGISIVHSHGFRADLIVSKIKRKEFVWLITAHSDPDSEKPHFLGKQFERWRKRTHINIIASNQENVYSVSSTIQQRFKLMGINIKTIHNGIDVSPKTSEEMDSDIKKKFNIPANKKVCLVLCGLTKKKNVETIIKAFLDDMLDNHFLIIAGDGEQFEIFKSMTADKPNIKMLGYVSNTENLFRISDYYLTASLFEGLSLSLLEAMYYKLIPIVSQIPSHIEVIGGSELEKFTFGCYDYLQLTSNLLELEKLDTNVLSEKSHDIIKNEYLADRMSSRYEEVYLSFF